MTTLHYFRYDLCVNLVFALVPYENAEKRYPRRTVRPKIDPLAYVRPTQKAGPA